MIYKIVQMRVKMK